VARPFWDELLRMKSPSSPRDFLNANQANIQYVNVDEPAILTDLDTPEDYEKWRPNDPHDKLSHWKPNEL
jgi:CTP:molybdopterin cytidylyltransferase MocA